MEINVEKCDKLLKLVTQEYLTVDCMQLHLPQRWPWVRNQNFFIQPSKNVATFTTVL